MPAVNKPVYAHFFGETREMVNGQVVKDTAVNTTYDGKNLHIDKRDNNAIAHYNIKDNELKKLLRKPMSKVDLLKRLSQDYKYKRTQKKKRSKRQKKKRSQKRRSVS